MEDKIAVLNKDVAYKCFVCIRKTEDLYFNPFTSIRCACADADFAVLEEREGKE